MAELQPVRATACFGAVNNNNNTPHTIIFRVVDPARDAHAILAALRAYWIRTGYLPRLERHSGAFWLRAPQDVFMEWMAAFGVPDDSGSRLRCHLEATEKETFLRRADLLRKQADQVRRELRKLSGVNERQRSSPWRRYWGGRRRDWNLGSRDP